MFIEMARAVLNEPPDPVCQALHKPPVRVQGEKWISSLDLGTQADPSAFAAMRVQTVEHAGKRVRYYDCPLLKRWLPKTASYDEIVDEVTALFADRPLNRTPLVVDMTGVGRPVVDLFRRVKIKARIVPITITAGHQVLPDEEGGWHVPKRQLASVVHVLLGGRRFNEPDKPLLSFAESKERAIVLKELENFKVKINLVTANVTFEAWREHQHDDLVLAVAMLAWWSEWANQRLTLA